MKTFKITVKASHLLDKSKYKPDDGFSWLLGLGHSTVYSFESPFVDPVPPVLIPKFVTQRLMSAHLAGRDLTVVANEAFAHAEFFPKYRYIAATSLVHTPQERMLRILNGEKYCFVDTAQPQFGFDYILEVQCYGRVLPRAYRLTVNLTVDNIEVEIRN